MEGLFLVAQRTGVYNPCLPRASKLNREIDEKIQAVPIARVAERNAVRGKKPGGRRVGNLSCPWEEAVQTYRLPERRSWCLM